jgi:putative Holliday junction resolvase
VSKRTRLLGIDTGSVRIGLAVSDPDRKFAFPLEVYERRNRDLDAKFFLDLIEREEIAGLVVGLPVHLDGREGTKAVEARGFGSWLAALTSLPVVYYDERFTTVQAESALWEAGLTHKRRKQRRDKVAAQMLLQSYLDAGCPTETAPGPLDDPPADEADST